MSDRLWFAAGQLVSFVCFPVRLQFSELSHGQPGCGLAMWPRNCGMPSRVIPRQDRASKKVSWGALWSAEPTSNLSAKFQEATEMFVPSQPAVQIGRPSNHSWRLPAGLRVMSRLPSSHFIQCMQMRLLPMWRGGRRRRGPDPAGLAGVGWPEAEFGSEPQSARCDCLLSRLLLLLLLLFGVVLWVF